MRTYNETKAVKALSTAARTNGTVNGDSVDRAQGYGYADVHFVVLTGTLTDGVHTITIEDSDNGSSWADAATADVVGTEPATTAASDDDKVFEFGYIGDARYVRIKVVTSGSTSGGTLGAVAILGHGRHVNTR